MIHRRKLLLKGSAFAAWAPAIVRASSLLPALAATDACGWAQGGGDIYPTGPSLILKPGREFAANSWVHTRLAPNAAIDPASAAVVARLVEGLTFSQTTIYNELAMPIYRVGPNQPTVRVVCACTPGAPCTLLQQQFNAVPMPDPNTFVPLGNSDLEAVIYQPSTHKMWEGWLWEKTGLRTTNSIGQSVDEWKITWGGYEADMRTNQGTWLTDPVTGQKPGMVASGIPFLAFCVTVGDLLQQEIRHPVGILTPQMFNRSDTWNNPPAQRTDGASTGPPNVPLGAIFRLPASFNLNSVPLLEWDGVSLKTFWRLFAEAMQRYGCVMFDSSPVAILISEGSAPYPVDPYTQQPLATIAAQSYINNADFPWSQMQVLQMNLVPS